MSIPVRYPPGCFFSVPLTCLPIKHSCLSPSGTPPGVCSLCRWCVCLSNTRVFPRQVPPRVFVLCAVGVFAYQTLVSFPVRYPPGCLCSVPLMCLPIKHSCLSPSGTPPGVCALCRWCVCLSNTRVFPRQVPPWVFVLCAVGVFVYQTLDALDGKQFYRTGRGDSPLEELTDHGADSISTVLLLLQISAAWQLGNNPSWMLFFCLTSMVLFYCFHWQVFVTRVVRFGK